MQKLNNYEINTEYLVQLPPETVNYLQRLDYELGGLQVLHTHALKADVPLEKRMELRRTYQETFAEYQMAKDELWAQFAPEHPHFKSWRVDFQTGLLHIVEAGEPREGRSHA